MPTNLNNKPNTSYSKPNILWIGVDQMRADSLVSTGVSTPNLDYLRSQCTTFTRAYSPSSLCTPARASMYTGRFAFNHGMGTNCDMYHALARELPQPEYLLHNHLQESGYRVGFTGKWHVGTELGPADYGFEGMSVPGYGDLRQDAGFQTYLKENNLSYGPIKDPIFANKNEQTLIAGIWNGPRTSTPTHYLTNYTLDLMEDFANSWHENNQPFFLTCQFWAPHGPYLPASEFAGTHNRSSIKPWPNWPDDFHGKPRRYPRLVNSFYANLPETWSEWQEVIGRAYDYTTQVDAEIGRLLARLEALDLVQDTIVIFESDHGDMLGGHGLYDKGYMYEEAHRIPLLIKLPGQEVAREDDSLVYNMDIFPTILDLAGIHKSNLDGQSLRPNLSDDEGGAVDREALYLEFHGIRYLRTERALVTREGLKYIFNPADDDELYDLSIDPAEMHNLLASEGEISPDQIEHLKILLMQTSKNYGDPIQNCISKWFGHWQGLSGQPDVSTAYSVEVGTD